MIGVVGETASAQRVVQALDSAGVEAALSPADALDGTALEAVVALGETALADVATAEPDVPVLPTELDGRLTDDDVSAVAKRVDQFRTGDAETHTDPLLAVTANAEPVGRSYFDVMLVRSDPGRISEYSWSAGQNRAQFRADGVVLATPRGSRGYAHAAGGPRLGLGAAVVAIVPVAAFGLGAAIWVQDPAEGIDLRVERDEGDVSLLLDGHERRRFSGRSSVTVRRNGSIETIGPPR